jgi:hypothetical protein
MEAEAFAADLLLIGNGMYYTNKWYGLAANIISRRRPAAFI